MARKEKIIDIQDDDQTLTFKIKQMSATRLLEWKYRALQLLLSSGVEVPEGSDLAAAEAYLMSKGPAELARLLGGLEYERVRPLLEGLLGCCSRLVEKVEERCTMDSVDVYIQNDTTLMRLYYASAQLNLNFTLPEGANLSAFPAGLNIEAQ